MVVNVGYNEQTAYASYLRISLLKNFVFWEAEWTSLAYSRFFVMGLGTLREKQVPLPLGCLIKRFANY